MTGVVEPLALWFFDAGVGSNRFPGRESGRRRRWCTAVRCERQQRHADASGGGGGIDVEMAEAKMLYGGGFVGRREKGTNDFARQEEGDPMAARGRTNRTDGHDYLDDVERVRA